MPNTVVFGVSRPERKPRRSKLSSFSSCGGNRSGSSKTSRSDHLSSRHFFVSTSNKLQRQHATSFHMKQKSRHFSPLVPRLFSPQAAKHRTIFFQKLPLVPASPASSLLVTPPLSSLSFTFSHFRFLLTNSSSNTNSPTPPTPA